MMIAKRILLMRKFKASLRNQKENYKKKIDEMNEANYKLKKFQFKFLKLNNKH